MLKEIIATGKDVAEAKENARAALGADPLADVQFEVLHAGSRGIFGIIGVKPAQVRAFIELPDRVERPRRERGERREAQPTRTKGAAETRTETEDAGEGAPARPKNDAGKSNRNNRRRRGGNRRPEEPIPDMTGVEPSKPKSVVIPECELKFEPREVPDGTDMSFEFIKALLANTGLSATAALFSCEDGTRRINISGKDASVLIGHHGDTLDALQYLANLASARKNINGERDKTRVTIDIEGYRAKREETLRALARRMAAKALRNKRSVMLEPMSAYERRIIHSEVQKIEGVSTNSIGSDNNRKIVIYLTDKKPAAILDDGDGITSLKEEFAPDTAEECVDIGQVEVSEAADLNPDEAKEETVAVRPIVPAEDDIPAAEETDGDDIK